MSCAVANLAIVPVAKSFKITTVEASYELTVFVLIGSIGSSFVQPFSNIDGRRPVYPFFLGIVLPVSLMLSQDM
jgi:hypothetical protein